MHVKEQWRDCRSSWYRPPQDWEEVSFDRFMAIVYSRKVQGVGPDRFVGSQQGVEVLRLEVSFFLPPTISFPWGVGVTIKGPSKGGFLFMVSLFR